MLALNGLLLAMQMIKDQMDKKFGAPWHVVVGRGFSYEITYEVGAAGMQGMMMHKLRNQGVSCAHDRPAPVPWRVPRAMLSVGCGHTCFCHGMGPHLHRLLTEGAHHESLHNCAHARCQVRNLLYIYVGGRTAVLLWKM